MNRFLTLLGLIVLVGCQSQTQPTQERPEISENRTSAPKKTFSAEEQERPEITHPEEAAEEGSVETAGTTTHSKTTQQTRPNKKKIQKTDFGSMSPEESKELDFYKEFNDKDQLLVAASLVATVANEAVSELLRFKENEIFLVCNKKDSKFQLMTSDQLLLKSWSLPKDVHFHISQENRILRYKKEFSIDPDTQRKVLQRMWIEYEDLQVPNGDSMLSYAILLVTSDQRKCIVDIDKTTGQTSIFVLN